MLFFCQTHSLTEKWICFGFRLSQHYRYNTWKCHLQLWTPVINAFHYSVTFYRLYCWVIEIKWQINWFMIKIICYWDALFILINTKWIQFYIWRPGMKTPVFICMLCLWPMRIKSSENIWHSSTLQNTKMTNYHAPWTPWLLDYIVLWSARISALWTLAQTFVPLTWSWFCDLCLSDTHCMSWASNSPMLLSLLSLFCVVWFCSGGKKKTYLKYVFMY